MKRSRFTEDQIIGILKEHEAGVPVAELCRKHGVSNASLYKWKAKYGGMDVSEARKLKALEDENARLKKLLADRARRSGHRDRGSWAVAAIAAVVHPGRSSQPGPSPTPKPGCRTRARTGSGWPSRRTGR